jgi:hypothetical protein
MTGMCRPPARAKTAVAAIIGHLDALVSYQLANAAANVGSGRFQQKWRKTLKFTR